jgi:tetratricopeptide (TPR) repeat protein
MRPLMSEPDGLDYDAAWGYQERGDLARAIDAYTTLYARTQAPRYLYHCGIAQLELGAYVASLEQLTRYTALEPARFHHASQYIATAACYWWLHAPDKAADALVQALDAPYRDAAGGVEAPALLLYVAERLDADEPRKLALKLFAKFVRRKPPGWPGPIAPLLLGKLDASAVEQAATRHPPMAPRRMCQADFYIGVRALRDGDRAEFQRRMTRAVTWNELPRELERYFALWEIAHDFPDHVPR